MSRERRREMVDRQHPALSAVRQCALLGISRSSLYYRSRGTSSEDLAVMKLIDQQYLATPFYGSRRMAVWLKRQGRPVSPLICWVAWSSPNPTRCGRRTSPTCPWPVASCTWWPSWIGTAAMCWLGACPTPWMPTVSNQQKWDTLGAERSGAGWRSGELPEGPVVASSPFGGLSLHLLPAL